MKNVLFVRSFLASNTASPSPTWRCVADLSGQRMRVSDTTGYQTDKVMYVMYENKWEKCKACGSLLKIWMTSWCLFYVKSYIPYVFSISQDIYWHTCRASYSVRDMCVLESIKRNRRIRLDIKVIRLYYLMALFVFPDHDKNTWEVFNENRLTYGNEYEYESVSAW